MFRKGNQEARKRKVKRGGRKPKAITLARNALVANKIVAAEAAFSFHEKIMFDKTQPLAMRAMSATWIYEQVMGKPLQRTAEGGADAYKEWQARVGSVLGIGDELGQTSTTQGGKLGDSAVPAAISADPNPPGA